MLRNPFAQNKQPVSPPNEETVSAHKLQRGANFHGATKPSLPDDPLENNCEVDKRA